MLTNMTICASKGLKRLNDKYLNNENNAVHTKGVCVNMFQTLIGLGLNLFGAYVSISTNELIVIYFGIMIALTGMLLISLPPRKK